MAGLWLGAMIQWQVLERRVLELPTFKSRQSLQRPFFCCGATFKDMSGAYGNLCKHFCSALIIQSLPVPTSKLKEFTIEQVLKCARKGQAKAAWQEQAHAC